MVSLSKFLIKLGKLKTDLPAKSQEGHFFCGYLLIFVCVHAVQKRIQNDERLVQIPDEHALCAALRIRRHLLLRTTAAGLHLLESGLQFAAVQIDAAR